jgi:hypothetical protein
MNPFGENDNDLDCNVYIDRNIRISYAMVDQHHNSYPELLKDAYWDKPPNIPYTLATYNQRNEQFMGSTAGVTVKDEEAYVVKDAIPEEGEEEEEVGQNDEAVILVAGTPRRNRVVSFRWFHCSFYVFILIEYRSYLFGTTNERYKKCEKP